MKLRLTARKKFTYCYRHKWNFVEKLKDYIIGIGTSKINFQQSTFYGNLNKPIIYLLLMNSLSETVYSTNITQEIKIPHIQDYKKQKVQEIAELLKSNKVIGLVNITSIPSSSIQSIRKKLRGKAIIRVAKNTLISLALDEVSKEKPNLNLLKEHIDKQTAIIFTELNPFKLYKEMEATKTKAPAKGGEIAQTDIIINAGETNFKPGPIVGELQKVGIPAAIDKGKVVIKNDKILVRQGEKINRDLAIALTKLEIFPLIIGFDLKVAYENGMVFKASVLAIDEKKILSNIKLGTQQAFNLAMFLAYPTKEIVIPLIQKAYKQGISLGINTCILNKETIQQLIVKGYFQAIAIEQIIKK